MVSLKANLIVTGTNENKLLELKNKYNNIISLKQDISAHDVAMCMLLLKVARIKHKATPDSYIDIAGYAAIAAEIEKED